MIGHVDIHVIHMADTIWKHRDLLPHSDKLISERTLEELTLLDEADIEMFRTCPYKACEPAFRARLRELEKEG